jgi:CRISPR/Cas system-associated protein Csm6
MLLRFFARLKKSEELLVKLSDGQQGLMDKLRTNAELERELVQSFSTRQAGLQVLNERLDARAAELNALLEQAENLSRSPQFLREVILSGKRKGRTSLQLAKATGLSLDEVELILAQADK